MGAQSVPHRLYHRSIQAWDPIIPATANKLEAGGALS